MFIWIYVISIAICVSLILYFQYCDWKDGVPVDKSDLGIFIIICFVPVFNTLLVFPLTGTLIYSILHR